MAIETVTREVKMAERDERLCLNVWPETGRLLGLSKNSTYKAARRGEIPTVRIGKRLLVPRKALLELLDGTPKDQPACNHRPSGFGPAIGF